LTLVLPAERYPDLFFDDGVTHAVSRIHLFAVEHSA
jgi:hypothetical protein